MGKALVTILISERTHHS